jgi:prevent-host-death family protein
LLVDGLDLVRMTLVQTVNIHAAKTHFSRLVDAAADGEEIIIARAGKPVAKLVPLHPRPEQARRVLGALIGKLRIPADFDAPLSNEELGQFDDQ